MKRGGGGALGGREVAVECPAGGAVEAAARGGRWSVAEESGGERW